MWLLKFGPLFPDPKLYNLTHVRYGVRGLGSKSVVSSISLHIFSSIVITCLHHHATCKAETLRDSGRSQKTVYSLDTADL